MSVLVFETWAQAMAHRDLEKANAKLVSDVTNLRAQVKKLKACKCHKKHKAKL